MKKERPKMDVGVYAKMDRPTYDTLEKIRVSHDFDSLAQALRWCIRQTARNEEKEEKGEE